MQLFAQFEFSFEQHSSLYQNELISSVIEVDEAFKLNALPQIGKAFDAFSSMVAVNVNEASFIVHLRQTASVCIVAAQLEKKRKKI